MHKSSLVRFLAPSSSPALANEGLFELTRRPLLTRAVSLSSAETTENPVVVRWKWHILTNFDLILAFSLDCNWILGSFRWWQRDGPCQRRAPSQLKKPFVGEGRRGGRSKETDETPFKYPNIQLYLLRWKINGVKCGQKKARSYQYTLVPKSVPCFNGNLWWHLITRW